MINLEEFELIKQLKARYFRALDTKDWPLMQDSLSTEAVARYDNGKYSFDGRDNILNFFKEYLGSPQKITLHQGHHPELSLTSETQAKGIWYLEDIVIDLDSNFTLRGAGYYHDEYKKIDGHWLITSTGYQRTFEEVEPRHKNLKVTKNMHQQETTTSD